MDIVTRLRQIADHDWRVSFLAHTSDTAKEAADEIERYRTYTEKLVERCERAAVEAVAIYKELHPSVERGE